MVVRIHWYTVRAFIFQVIRSLILCHSLLAATLGPLANMLSIAALVTYWRTTVLVNGTYVNGPEGKKFPDPIW